MSRGLQILWTIVTLAVAPGAWAAKTAHYDVHVRFEPRDGSYDADVTLTLPPEELKDPAFLLGGNVQIDSIAVGHGGGSGISAVDKPLPGLKLVTARFKEAPSRPVKIRFRYRGSINEGREEPAFTNDFIELRLEYFWLPVRRDLGLFYTVRARLEGIPEGITVVAQNDFRQRGTTLEIDRTTPDNDVPVAGVRGMQKRVTPHMEFYTTLPGDPLIDHIYTHARGASEFFAGKFGPLPEPLRVITMPRTSGGAYARRHWIAISSFPKGAPTPEFDPLNPSRTIAHEIYHAWLPSPEGGGENHWIAESLAEYSALRYIEKSLGEQNMNTLLARKIKPALEAGSLLTPDRPSRAALYQKGPLLLFKLEDRIGRAALDGILYRNDRARSTEEFMAALQKAAGNEVTKEFYQQLLATGVPADLVKPVRYSVVMAGAVKGELSVLPASGRERHITFKYDDRGRGPDLKIVSRFDERGWPLGYQLTGSGYNKRPTKETFSVTDGKAQWTSNADSREVPATGYYLPSEANAEDLAALARALLHAKGELALLPAGQVRMHKKQSLQVTGSAGTINVTLYLISGIELQPQPLWLDADNELFAVGSTWQSTVRAGFEHSLAQLISAQSEALSAERLAQAKTLRTQSQRPVLIRNAVLFDAEHRAMKPGMSVLVRGDRIASVAPDAGLPVSDDVEIIDAQGKTLLPGLWDMHAHILSENEGAVSLMAGVINARDLGNDAEALQRLTDLFDAGALPGPWVSKAALIDARGPLGAPIGTLVSTPQEMRDAVNAAADRGYQHVKFYSSLSRELLDVGIAAARRRDLYVSGHVPAGLTVQEAVRAGYRELHHVNFLFLTFMSPQIVQATNTPVRFSAVLEHGHELDLQSSKVRRLISLLRERAVAVDPTLVTFENMFTGYRGEMTKWMRPWADLLPAGTVRGGRTGGRAQTPEERSIYTESFLRMKQMVKLLHDAGIPIVPGTDSTALMLARELELYVEAGIPPADVLYLATLGSARVAKRADETGSITAGKRADMILVDGQPLKNISDVRRIALVIKGGARYDIQALAGSAGLRAPLSAH